MGYYRAGFDVVGVDIAPQKNYPFEFHQADAMTYPLEGFDAIHASPPCQAYIQRNKNLQTKHPKLIAPTRKRLLATALPYVIENVLREVLLEPVMLCGTFFGLRVIRHRFFESAPRLLFQTPCHHWGTVAAGDFAAVYEFGGKGHRHGAGQRDPKSAPGPDWAEAMGIDWMETRYEIKESIPPAYTEYIGKQLLAML